MLSGVPSILAFLRDTKSFRRLFSITKYVMYLTSQINESLPDDMVCTLLMLMAPDG